MLLTVPEAAQRACRNPETIRRWIREGKLRARKIGTQHVIEETDLGRIIEAQSEMLPLPATWSKTASGAPMPDVVSAVRRARKHSHGIRTAPTGAHRAYSGERCPGAGGLDSSGAVRLRPRV
ncbi:MAG: helix-turn-helix domain-containing protein [Chloroflexi bacterium]|nr:helix-turn-helix domain-containing protein [Chloroflexota bacterium]